MSKENFLFINKRAELNLSEPLCFMIVLLCSILFCDLICSALSFLTCSWLLVPLFGLFFLQFPNNCILLEKKSIAIIIVDHNTGAHSYQCNHYFSQVYFHDNTYSFYDNIKKKRSVRFYILRLLFYIHLFFFYRLNKL